MLCSNRIQSLLDIQDPNVIFDEDCVKEGTYKGKRCTYIFGKLTYTPTHCVKCDVKNTDFTVYKNGTQVSRTTLPITGKPPTYLLLQKQCFMCQACQSSFTAKTPIVQRNCFIIDRFHLIQLINRSMNKCRIQFMNQLRMSNGDDMKKYRRLKRYWKLLLKKRSDLSSVEYKYYPLFGQRTGQSIVDEMLNYDPVLKANDELYQELMASMANKDFEALSSCLTNAVPSAISNDMRTSLKTLRKQLPFVENSFIYPYNNGRMEGNNNKIKVLNRVASGYRNFQNDRKRILLHFELKQSVKQQEQGQSHFEAA